MTYIWERSKWPELTWDTQHLSPLVARVSHEQGRLLGRMESLGFDQRCEAHLSTLTEDVIMSSEIEGENLPRNQVRSSIAQRLGIEINDFVRADYHVEGVVEMMMDATSNYKNKLNQERLFGWHAALFPTGRSGMSKIITGGWRDDATGPMQVVSGPISQEKVHFEAPPAARIPQEMEQFLDWFENPGEGVPLLTAGLAHLRFVTIHPFADGNGRIARAIADMALARADQSSQRFYSMSAQIRRERDDYYMMLERTQKGETDITLWQEWFLNCLLRTIESADQTVNTVLQKARFWQRFAEESFNDRQIKVLKKLLDGFEGKMTSTKWAKIAKCSHDTAYRDITDLIARGTLQKDPGGGRSTSYSLILK